MSMATFNNTHTLTKTLDFNMHLQVWREGEEGRKEGGKKRGSEGVRERETERRGEGERE